MGVEALVVGGVLGGISAFQQHEARQDAKDATKKQARESKRQAQLAQRQADIQNARQVRAAMRQARIARASIVNTGANAGTLGSSGVLGGVASVGSQLNSNLSYFGEMDTINDQSTASQVRSADAAVDAAEAQGSAATWGVLGSLGGTIFDAGGGWKSVFDKTKNS